MPEVGGNIKPGSTSRDFESERRGRRRTIVCGLEFAEKHRNEFTARPTSAAAADFGLGGGLEPLANERGGHCSYRRSAALPLVQPSASLSSFAESPSNHNTAHKDPFRSATKLTRSKGLYMNGQHTYQGAISGVGLPIACLQCMQRSSARSHKWEPSGKLQVHTRGIPTRFGFRYPRQWSLHEAD